MALSVAKGVITSPGSTGNQTYTVGFQPKAVLLWAEYATAEGRSDGDGIFSMGWGTYDGAAVQQGYTSYFDDDAAATTATARGINTTACLKGYSAATPTVDYEVRLDSFTATAFVLNWQDLPATPSIKVHYLALGGADITAARCGAFALTTAVATQDVTINAGFGQPDLLFFLPTSGVTALGDSSGNALLSLSAAKAAGGRGTFIRNATGQGTVTASLYQHTDLIAPYSSASAADAKATLSAQGSWPTDGFQLSYSDQAATASQNLYLALKGTFTSTVGSTTTPTAAAPQVSDLDHGSVPKAALFWGGNVIGYNTSITQADADLFAYFVGGTDGTNEGMAGVANDDANTDSFAGRFHSESKAVAMHVAGALTGDAPQLTSQADSSVSGNNVRLTFDDTDTLAREFNYVLLGDEEGEAVVPAAVPTMRLGRRRRVR